MKSLWRVSVIVAVFVAAALGIPAGVVAESDTLPARLTHEQFWRLSTTLSEPSAAFISDNLVSNEMSFAHVVPELRSWGVTDGVYLGVGPEQNFTYLEVMRARFGFIVDIRRENLLLHLLYKSLFDLAPDRATFVAQLFGRPGVAGAGTDLDGAGLMVALEAAPRGSEADYEAIVQRVARTLAGYRAPLSAADLGTIRGVQRAFYEYGPDITYASTQLRQRIGLASFANLMRQVDADGRALGFLRSEEAYRFVRDLQLRNVVVPVIGNFAGPTTIRAIGRYLRDHQALVSAFYVSNVEDYLGRERSIPRNGDWRVFCENVSALPIDERSIFIRPHGFAVRDTGGVWKWQTDMLVSSTSSDGTTAGPTAPPSALSRIAPEVRDCASARFLLGR